MFKTISIFLPAMLVWLPLTSIAGQSYTVYKDVVFATHETSDLKLDLYIPQYTETPPPLVVWIHGGAWLRGSKDEPEFLWLSEYQGFALASISYRFSNVAKFPAQIHDCKGAVRWLRANSARYGYSSDKIAVAGISAGGMLAALMGTSQGVSELEGTVGGNLDQSTQVNAVINFFGATDFVLRSRTQPNKTEHPGSTVYTLLGGSVSDNIELAKLASAVSHVTKDDPPLLVFHGGRDRTVLPDQSEAIVKTYRAMNLEVQYKFIEEAGHDGRPFNNNEETRKRIAEFLTEHLR